MQHYSRKHLQNKTIGDMEVALVEVLEDAQLKKLEKLDGVDKKTRILMSSKTLSPLKKGPSILILSWKK